MKFIVSLFLLSLSYSASANSETLTSDECKKGATVVSVIAYDGAKKNRKNKRLNKKRKRKCSQFGRKIYAG